MENEEESLAFTAENLIKLRNRCILLENVNCASWISRMALVMLDRYAPLVAACAEQEGKYNDPYAPPGGPAPEHAKWHFVQSTGQGWWIISCQHQDHCAPHLTFGGWAWETGRDISVIKSQSYTGVLAQFPWQGSLRPVNLPPEF